MPAFLFLSVVSLFAFFAFEPPSLPPREAMPQPSILHVSAPAAADAWLEAVQRAEPLIVAEGTIEDVPVIEELPDGESPVSPEEAAAPQEIAEEPQEGEVVPADELPLENERPVGAEAEPPVPVEEHPDPTTLPPEEQIAMPALILDEEAVEGAPGIIAAPAEEETHDIVELLQGEP